MLVVTINRGPYCGFHVKVILPFFLTASFRRLSARMIRFCSVLLFCVGVVYGVSLEML